jgi:hypothetical protein
MNGTQFLNFETSATERKSRKSNLQSLAAKILLLITVFSLGAYIGHKVQQNKSSFQSRGVEGHKAVLKSHAQDDDNVDEGDNTGDDVTSDDSGDDAGAEEETDAGAEDGAEGEGEDGAEDGAEGEGEDGAEDGEGEDGAEDDTDSGAEDGAEDGAEGEGESKAEARKRKKEEKKAAKQKKKEERKKAKEEKKKAKKEAKAAKKAEKAALRTGTVTIRLVNLEGDIPCELEYDGKATPLDLKKLVWEGKCNGDGEKYKENCRNLFYLNANGNRKDVNYNQLEWKIWKRTWKARRESRLNKDKGGDFELLCD